MANLEEIRARLKHFENQTVDHKHREAEQAKLVKILKGTYHTERHVPVILDPGLQCPRCSGENLHHQSVELFNRHEDAEQGDHITIAVPESLGWEDEFGLPRPVTKSSMDSNMKNNPSSRRTGVVINFCCEGCGHDLTLNIAQHKGTTEMYWNYIRYQEHGQ